jgi:hypothetical protein
MGQKYLHHPLSIKNINNKNKIKIINAIQKNGFGTNLLGYNIRVGIVPVRKPTGHISVNINPIM